jgi:hypothetical protein
MTNAAEGPRIEEVLKIELEHSRTLFVYHATQRTSSLNYYFVAMTALLSGFVLVVITPSLEPTHRACIGLVLGVAGAYLTWCFKGLDRRNEQLVDSCKKVLINVEKRMNAVLANEDGAALGVAPERPMSGIIFASDEMRPKKVRYRFIVPRIFHLYMILSAAGGLYAFWPLGWPLAKKVGAWLPLIGPRG